MEPRKGKVIRITRYGGPRDGEPVPGLVGAEVWFNEEPRPDPGPTPEERARKVLEGDQDFNDLPGES